MKISYNWLKRYLDFDYPPSIVAEAITRLGLEVEKVETLGVAANEKLVVGEILSRDKHPNADKLSVCKVNVGSGPELQIVCGAPNCDAGNRVAVALVGCHLPYTENGEAKTLEIKAAKLRGVESQGMMCGADEIGMAAERQPGLMILDAKLELGRKVHEVLPSDTVFEIAVLPNRPDALSHFGLARDLAAKWDLKLKKIHAHKIHEKKPHDFKAITIEDTEGCPHYRGVIIRGVQVGPSPSWLQDLLKTVGLRSISNIVDITNYVCLGLGQPLHAFDLQKIEGGELIVRRGREGETLVCLDGPTRQMDASVLVIADARKPLAMAGIMGGVESSVTAATTDILLEAADFSPTLIRKTSRKKGASSDSSYRYERGIDPLGVEMGSEVAVAMILELAGGKIDGGAIVTGQPPFVEKKFLLSREFLVEKLGFTLDHEKIESALLGFGFKLKHKGESSWEVTVPSYRLDIERPIDLVEEVLRCHGVDRIPAATLVLPANAQRGDRLYAVTRQLSHRLIALGYNECMHYTLRTRAEAELLEGTPEAAALHSIENPLSAEMSSLRYSLLPGLLEALELNRSRGNSAAPLFEVGHIFRCVTAQDITQGAKLNEFQSLAFVKIISPTIETWQKNRPAADFFDAKAVIESLLQAAGISCDASAWEIFSSASGALWQPHHSAKLFLKGVSAAAGIVNFNVTKAASFAGTVLAGEILLPLNFFADDAPPKRYAAFSAFPGTRRDVALVVKSETPAGDVKAKIKNFANEAIAGKFDLESVALFDLYQGAGVPEGHKSLAFALNFRAADRTLTDDEAGAVFNVILEKLKAAGYAIRS